MYDVNQIPWDYTMEMTKRFKVLDLIDKMVVEIWKEVHDIVQDGGLVTKCVRLLQLHGL